MGESSRYSTQVRLYLCDLKITIQAAQAPAKQAVLSYALFNFMTDRDTELDPLSSRERQWDRKLEPRTPLRLEGRGSSSYLSIGQTLFGSPRCNLLEGKAGPAEHPDPDFLWLERSIAEGKISMFEVVNPSFSCPGQSLYYFDSVPA